MAVVERSLPTSVIQSWEQLFVVNFIEKEARKSSFNKVPSQQKWLIQSIVILHKMSFYESRTDCDQNGRFLHLGNHNNFTQIAHIVRQYL